MADTTKPDSPDKEKLAVNSDPAPKEQPIPEKTVPAPPDKKPHAPTVGGADQPVPEQKSDIDGIDFPSGKKMRVDKPVKTPEPPGKGAPALKEPSRDSKDKPEVPPAGGDSPAAKTKEQAAPDAKKPVARSTKPTVKADQPEKPAAKRGRPKGAAKAAPSKEKPQAAPIKKSTPEKKEGGNEPPPLLTVPKTLRTDAPRAKKPEQIVYLKLEELHPFKGHPFAVRDDNEMRSLVESVKDKGVNQPALVRRRPDGEGYELVAGHRRQRASEIAGFKDMPCIVRDMTDDEAILAMTDDNLRQRSEILPSERAISLKMQIEAIKHQGEHASDQVGQKDAGKRSVDIVAEKNSLSAANVQRYVRLAGLEPDLLKAVDEKRLKFIPAVELSFITRKNQKYIAVSSEGEQKFPSLDQAKKMRELDQKGQLNNDVIDGILTDKAKEVEKVILSGAELEKYFGEGKTPREMKNQIMKLLDDWKEKQPAIEQPTKQPNMEK